MQKNRMRICVYDNERGRQFNLTELVFLGPGFRSFECPLRDNGRFNDLDQRIKDVITRLFQIPGVVYVSIEAYAVVVKIGKAFEWKNVESRVQDLLAKKFFHDEAYELVHGNYDEKEKPSPIIIADKWMPARLPQPILHT